MLVELAQSADTIAVMEQMAGAARRINEQIADVLQREITSGKLAPGTKLPAVRTIAADHGVAVATAGKALQLLVSRGLIRPDSTRGYFVSAPGAGAAEEGHGSEFRELMGEIAAIRAHLARLDERLVELEQERR
ncbi:winged helix-turn-helix domain-containing protein [Streptomyces sp. NPDC051994]|uniref:GntR family transcriptional regulator n=1 Tax=unclassified Streptomyces TaxID=2593676 RepID=UPI003437837F